LKTVALVVAGAIALLCLQSCAGTTTAVGLTTTQDAAAADKNPH
jgi:hypothetical protein